MKKTVLIMTFLFCTVGLTAQIDNYDLKEGDIVELGETSGTHYRNIEFPRKNIIIKRGAIADFKSLVGRKLRIEKLETNKNNEAIATLKRTDGLNFFRFYPQVKANISKALTSGELKLVDDNKQGAIAQK